VGGGGADSKLGPLGTSATYGLLYMPQVIVRMENSVEWRLAGETEVLGEILPHPNLSTTNSTWPDPVANRVRRGGKPATDRLSYCAT
jgi:hypothetical protein